MNIVYVHGANASPVSFAYIKSNLPKHDHVDVSYDCEKAILPVAKQIAGIVSDFGGDVSIVSHSLGGVLAIIASEISSPTKLLTISSPFGGIKYASYLRWMDSSNLMNEIHPASNLMVSARYAKPSCPILSIVSTSGGLEMYGEPNDGVVTVASQTAFRGPEYAQVPLNHFEVLLSGDVTAKIESFLWS